jgi:phage-related protein (TIGR01555 family)
MNILNKIFKRETRNDGLSNDQLGMGTDRDKLSYTNPNASSEITPNNALQFWKALSILRKVVNAPAEDSVRNGWTIQTNINPDLDRSISNRLYEIDVTDKLIDTIRYMRIYSKGSLVYYCITDSNKPQYMDQLGKPIENIDRLETINVLDADQFNLLYNTNSPLSSLYDTPDIFVEGIRIHPSRYRWSIKDYNRKLQTGRSTLDDCLESIKSHGIAHWSVTSIFTELASKVFKSPSVGKDLEGKKLQEFLQRLRLSMSSQTVLALNTDEAFEKQTYNLTGVKEALDFIIETISIVSEIPQARLKGAAHGVLASGNYDMLSYFESVKRLQTTIVYPILNDLVNLVIRENNPEVRKFVSKNFDKVDWEIKFNPLWELSDTEKADIELKRSQRDKADIESGKITPIEARQLDKRLSGLEPLDIDTELS